MSLSTLLKPKTLGVFYDFQSINIGLAEWDSDCNLKKSCIKTHLSKYIESYINKVGINKERIYKKYLGNGDLYNRYEYYTFFLDLYETTDDLYNIIELKTEELKTVFSMRKYTDLVEIIDIQNKEIKLLNDKIDKLQKDYNQLMINWKTINEYMKKIDFIESKLLY
jgi:predicted  nucleic acid-binding Zn-ribbon protein